MANTSQPLNTAVLEQLAAQSNRVTNEELVLAAMFGKQLQSDINGIKKQSAEVKGSLKITDIDMSKVMPSHILPAMGIKSPKQPERLPPQIPQVPIAVPNQPIQTSPQVQIQMPVMVNAPVQDDNQLELNFNKVTRYEDVIEAIEKLEKKVIMINNKLDQLIEDKKKLIDNGT